jgi:carboxypeptidase C (cathepsin A)
VIVALLAGAGIGSAITNNAAALSAANRKLTASRGRVGSLQAEYSAAKTQAQQATTTADARAQASYAARNAALATRSKSLDQRAKAISTLEGQVQSSTISADGVYVVGKDIPSGTYHTTGDGGQTDNECYFATLHSSNTSDISDNNNFDGPETVDVSGAYALQINGPCTWVRAG